MILLRPEVQGGGAADGLTQLLQHWFPIGCTLKSPGMRFKNTGVLGLGQTKKSESVENTIWAAVLAKVLRCLARVEDHCI